MIPDLPPNTRSHPYRGLSVQEVGISLDDASLLAWIVGREVYRRTEFLALRNSGATALLEVRKASLEPLFSPVVEARVLAGPEQVVWVDDPDTEVGIASALAAAAARHPHPGARAWLVQGRHEHVNFIWDPAPQVVRVAEVTPPEPPKLLDQARRVLAFDEDLPPVELQLDAIDLAALAAANPAATYLLPCRGSGADLAASVEFLDTRPAERGDWLLIGCERSVQFHRHFYGDAPPQVDFCPLKRMQADPPDCLALVKCCQRERGVELLDKVAVVPWGASLDEVREALRLLVGVDRQSAVSGGAPLAR